MEHYIIDASLVILLGYFATKWWLLRRAIKGLPQAMRELQEARDVLHAALEPKKSVFVRMNAEQADTLRREQDEAMAALRAVVRGVKVP